MSTSKNDSFQSRATIQVGDRQVALYRLDALTKAGVGDVATLPYSLRILLENLLRHEDGNTVTKADIEALASWDPSATPSEEVAYRPARVLLQDFTGVPAVVDLAAMREAFVEMGGDAADINPLRRSDLVIDHSVQVDTYGTAGAFRKNVEIEYQRNRERYLFLRWGQQAFENLSVVPPGTGIVHQVNLEYLAPVVFSSDEGGVTVAYPDTLVGTDSHTTMINGIGVMGWGVGGIEAEAAQLGQPIPLLIPQVVGFKLTGRLPEGATATDLVLTVVEMLRRKGVVGKFVEFYGDGLDHLSLPDRATIANMAPEYGATMGFFPVDDETLAYLRFSGRAPEQVELVERYCKEQGLFRTADAPEPRFTDTLALDLATVVPSIAGPKRPQDRIALSQSKPAWHKTLGALSGKGAPADEALRSAGAEVTTDKGSFKLANGHVVIAAITSCTNTSNPNVMLAAGLLARKARAKGLNTKPWVKTSLAPGSQVVTEYYKEVDLLADLEALGFHLVGYGCTTCIGNSGPVHEAIAKAVKDNDMVVTSVLSGNRNFEGRISPVVRANYLASPPLVVAYALAGTLDIDFESQPLGQDGDGKDVFLRDIWPSPQEVTECLRQAIKSEMYTERYGQVFDGDDDWRALAVPAGDIYAWDDSSTYIRKPSFFDDIKPEVDPLTDIKGARVMAMLGDSVTTDHISPAGSIAVDSPAGKYLVSKGVEPKDFNSYGSRRGNHEVMMRGTFANIRLRNLLAPGTEGGITRHLPDGAQMTIYDAAMKYAADKVPLVVLAGTEYGTGSSRDWAAKGTYLLGVKAVIAGSFERIHRSNLIGMGVLPLEFAGGQTRESLGLTGEEVYDIEGIAGGLSPRQSLTVRAGDKTFQVTCRLDTPQEVEYYVHGGILRYVLRTKAQAKKAG
ncbi:aconitate hydratase AcnA [Haliangium sp.]|uniref:aconitate hydratase AcnA n=1 Tax=Haliangium sp. TaxID=2663208 RepID=UPI003D09CB30